MKDNMNYPDVSESLRQLRLHPLLPDIGELILECENKKLPPMMTLKKVLGTAALRRQAQRLEMQLKMARFPTAATLENFDFSNIDQSSAKTVQGLEDCDWIVRGENLLFRGASGLGKTHLAIALGKKAVSEGYRTLFVEANALFRDLRKWNQTGELQAKLKNLAQVKLLIIDDIGYATDSSSEDAPLFYALINGRYTKSSTIITTNRKVGDWIPALSGDDTCMRAAIDRFVHLCHNIKLKGKSYRLQQFEAREGVGQSENDEALHNETDSDQKQSE